jgi:quinol monooxygenase YgiN
VASSERVKKVLVTIQHDVEPAKREAFLAHVREMREHAVGTLKLDYQVYEHEDHANRFTEIFACASPEDYEALDERQDDAFREMVARLDRFTDVAKASYAALVQVP